ncbi:MAG TPA: 30S ribosome-binding factor RbfA [Solirubrobacteraceae bacterium]|jgi:ribosome-binding factor A
MRRVDEAVRQVLGDAVTHQLKDPRVGFVTVTDVKTSPDLRHARVFVSILGSRTERLASLEGLRSAHGFLQRHVAGELRLKHTPELEFIPDDTTQRAFRIERLLREAQTGEEG